MLLINLFDLSLVQFITAVIRLCDQLLDENKMIIFSNGLVNCYNSLSDTKLNWWDSRISNIVVKLTLLIEKGHELFNSEYISSL